MISCVITLHLLACGFVCIGTLILYQFHINFICVGCLRDLGLLGPSHSVTFVQGVLTRF